MYKFYFKCCSIQFPQFFLIFFVISSLIHIFLFGDVKFPIILDFLSFFPPFIFR